MAKAEHEVLIAAPIERVFKVVSDYERYPDFLPETKEVQVVSRQGSVLIVRFELEVLMRVGYTLRIHEEAPTRISWTLEDAKMLTANTGGWRFDAVGPQTRATYALEVELRGLIPKSVSTRLLGTTLPLTLERFKARVEASR